MVTLMIASVAKSWLLAHHLKQKVSNLRWSLIGAALPAAGAGLAAVTFLPGRLAMLLGIPGILAVYCGVMWYWGFVPADRVLFRRNVDEPA